MRSPILAAPDPANVGLRTLSTLRAMRPAARPEGASWYSITNVIAGESADVLIYDEIGYWGISADAFARELSATQVKTLNVRVNSPGGEVFDGVAIYNTLLQHPATVNVVVEGLAASIASVIAQAGDTLTMMPASRAMIHDASGLAMGNATDMRSYAGLLDSVSVMIAEVYAARAGGDAAAWRDLMLAETWFTPSEALAAGLIDGIEGAATEDAPATDTARWDLSLFNYAGRDKAPAPDLTHTNPPAPESVAASALDLGALISTTARKAVSSGSR